MTGIVGDLRYASRMGSEEVGPYLETPEVLRLCKLPYSTLDSWVRTGLVTPSIRGGSGKRRTRLWSVADVVGVRALKELRDAGAPTRVLTKAHRTLHDTWTTSLRGQMLYWDGGDLIHVDEWSNLMSLVKKPGQSVFRMIAMPLDEFRREAEAAATTTPTLPPHETRRTA